MIATTLILYLSLYVLLLTSYVTVIFYLARKAAKGELQPEATRLDNPANSGVKT